MAARDAHWSTRCSIGGGATTGSPVPVPAGLLHNTMTYFDALTAYREGDPNPVVARFNDGTFTAINDGSVLAADLSIIHENWRTALAARRDCVAWRILPTLLSQPALTSRVVQDRRVSPSLLPTEPSSTCAPPGWCNRGTSTEKTADKTSRSGEVLAALDRFGDRARRRTC